MKKVFLLFALTSFIFYNHTIAQNSDKARLNITPLIGVGHSKTSFNIAGNEQGTNPNILSELKWTNTVSLQYGAKIDVNYNRFHLETGVQFQRNISGDVSDIDYEYDNRQGAYSKLYLSNHKGNGFSISLEPGFQVIKTSTSTLTPFLSFEYNKKRNYLLNQKHWNNRNIDYINNLNSYYEYKFPLFGLGILFSQQWSNKFNSDIKIEGHISKYNAYGNWNLRSDFQQPISYEHKANGYSISPELKLNYLVTPKVGINLTYNMHYYTAKDGKDYLYSSSEGTLKSKLNEVNFLNQQLTIGTSIRLTQ